MKTYRQFVAEKVGFNFSSWGINEPVFDNQEFKITDAGDFVTYFRELDLFMWIATSDSSGYDVEFQVYKYNPAEGRPSAVKVFQAASTITFEFIKKERPRYIVFSGVSESHEKLYASFAKNRHVKDKFRSIGYGISSNEYGDIEIYRIPEN